MEDVVYDSLMNFAKKLIEQDRTVARPGSYLPIETPVRENYSERIARIMKSTREAEKREE